MKAFSVIALLTIAINSFASSPEAIEQLNSLIKPGHYIGTYKNAECSFTYSVKNDVAFIELNNDAGSLKHKFTDHDGIVFTDWKGDFMSNYINRTNDVTVYSIDTFRLIKNEEETYIVIEKLFINNRDTKRQKIECIL